MFQRIGTGRKKNWWKNVWEREERGARRERERERKKKSNPFIFEPRKSERKWGARMNTGTYRCKNEKQ